MAWQDSWHWHRFMFKTIEMFLKAFENAPPKMQAHFCDQGALKTIRSRFAEWYCGESPITGT